VTMTVDVEIGKAYVADTLVEKGAITNLAVTAADPTNPRKDIVVCNSAGTLSIVVGTAEAALPSDKVGVYTLEPEPPSIPANSIILAEIWVPAGATSITGSEIYDKRVFTVDRLGKARLEWALNKILKGAGAGSDPTEVDMPAGDMAKAIYDPDADGKIALAQLVDAVCSETEALSIAQGVTALNKVKLPTPSGSDYITPSGVAASTYKHKLSQTEESSSQGIYEGWPRAGQYLPCPEAVHIKQISFLLYRDSTSPPALSPPCPGLW
ncbi:unnamed protein product, partial [marine sediment metagenome]